MRLDDLSVVITTFIRPKELMRAVASVRKFYPDIEIMVADNGRYDIETADFLARYRCGHILLPFDSGLAMTRNEALDNLMDKPYILMMEDDMEFTEESVIEKFKAVIEAHPDLGVVAGGLELDDGTKNLFANQIVIDEEKNMYKVSKIKNPEWHETGGVKWYYADYVYNFHIMRNAPDIRWDADLKQCIEHFDFAVHMRLETDWKVAATPDVVCKHHLSEESSEYVKHRRNFETWKIFFKKRGIRFLESDSEKTMRDFKSVEKLSYPEYMYRMILAMNTAQSGVDMKSDELYVPIT